MIRIESSAGGKQKSGQGKVRRKKNKGKERNKGEKNLQPFFLDKKHLMLIIISKLLAHVTYSSSHLNPMEFVFCKHIYIYMHDLDVVWFFCFYGSL